MAPLRLLLAGALAADPGVKPLSQLCPLQTALTRRVARRGAFDVTPAINTLMLNIIDGKLPQIRQQLNAMPASEAVRWRQSALIVATYVQNLIIVEALLHAGAAIDRRGWIPNHSRRFHDQAVDAVQKDPGWTINRTIALDAHPDAAAVRWLKREFDGPPR